MNQDPIYPTSAPRVAVVGATGLVGKMLLQILEERHFPVAQLLPLAGPNSLGKRIHFRGKACSVEQASSASFEGLDLVFFAASGELSRNLAPLAVKAGARVIDKSSTWRLDPSVPLVVPEVNGELIQADTTLVASPNCTTTGLVMALQPLHQAAGLRRVQVTTLQAASGAGRAALQELFDQESSAAKGQVPTAQHWPAVLAGNVLPLCDRLEHDGSSAEEHKLLHETRKIMGLPELELMATCTRVPVAVGHGASVWVETERELSCVEARAALSGFPGVRLTEQSSALDVAGSDEVLVGRLRRPLAGSGIQFWQVSDNLRKGAATNAVQIAELMLKLN